MADQHKHFIADIPQKAIMEHNGKVLIVQDDKGMWELPGGRLHNDETPPDGLKREIREELSTEIRPTGIFDTFVFTSASGAKHFLVIYLCEPLDDIRKIVAQEDEIKDMRWIGADEFDSLQMRNEYREVLKKFFNTKNMRA